MGLSNYRDDHLRPPRSTAHPPPSEGAVTGVISTLVILAALTVIGLSAYSIILSGDSASSPLPTPFVALSEIKQHSADGSTAPLSLRADGTPSLVVPSSSPQPVIGTLAATILSLFERASASASLVPMSPSPSQSPSPLPAVPDPNFPVNFSVWGASSQPGVDSTAAASLAAARAQGAVCNRSFFDGVAVAPGPQRECSSAELSAAISAASRTDEGSSLVVPGCRLEWFWGTRVCDLLQAVGGLDVVGDSLMRHLLQTLRALAIGDLKRGFSGHLGNESWVCDCDGAFDDGHFRRFPGARSWCVAATPRLHGPLTHVQVTTSPRSTSSAASGASRGPSCP